MTIPLLGIGKLKLCENDLSYMALHEQVVAFERHNLLIVDTT
jgi:hypothetical protein